MLYIRSQRKDVIYSFGNGYTSLSTTTDREYSKRKKDSNHEETSGKIYFDKGCCEDIGIFSSEDVAKEILNEIWEKLSKAKGCDVFYQIPEYR